ncbi:MAG: HIT domain-containing protein [Armatimonadota bacterium]|nr:HIT domain-containing protein [Armatimonadota bacterium]MDR7400702.1 HIT domain-containing protein [Armatimonadota bacterium]MDR7403635.1 HIT domain-containing protein [Armatimonadota bacterium]MDR7436487.1 HIT domain-containing protein [Armatimonadota bacterium]MDR7472522.1 HIT domain-containing protein [Armatimonadota bacterium]
MRQLWAPWRVEYIRQGTPGACIFCAAAEGSDDRAALVVARGRRCFVLLNRFPYNSGHVMVVPYRHCSRLADLEDAEATELIRYTDYSVRAAERALRPEGYNIGLNLGRAAGAGIEDHLHVHVVPRWVGDTNFMPVLGDVKVIPEHLEDTRRRLAEAFAAVLREAGEGER